MMLFSNFLGINFCPWYHLIQALWPSQLTTFFFKEVALLAWCAEFKTAKADAVKVFCAGQKGEKPLYNDMPP